jgi:hypothetical protein
MVSFKCQALAMLIAQASVVAQESSLRASVSRKLSFESIAGYTPGSQVTDHNAIDLDQQEIEVQLSDGTDDSISIAKAVYEEGAFSKSYAKVKLTTPLSSKLNKGDKIKGKNADGKDVDGKALKTFESGVRDIEVQYSTTDIQDSYVGCQVGALALAGKEVTEGCFATEGTFIIGSDTYEYTYDVKTQNKNARTIQGFSTAAGSKMEGYVDFEKFKTYYGVSDYADQWVLAAFDKARTDFNNGDANFGLYGLAGQKEVIKKGTAYMNIWMYVVREFEDALDDCNDGCINCNDDPVHAWDEGVAFYTGSIEGNDGAGDGKLLYGLADKRCQNYKTCGTDGEEASGTSKINYDLMQQFAVGQQNLVLGNCAQARVDKERIVELMAVPLVQGTIRYAYKVGEVPTSGEKEAAEGAVFAAAVLPIVHACNKADAQTIYNNMKVGASSTDYLAVKKAFENNYSCMGITCKDVGGLWDSANGKYYANSSPCKDSSTSSSDSNALAISLGTVAGVVTVAAVGFFLYLRKREIAGTPVWEPAKEIQGESS